MGRCETCKHWKTTDVRIVTQGWAAKQTHPDGTCNWKVGHSDPDPVYQVDDQHRWGECRRGDHDGALVSAECQREGIAGEMMTAAEFGCLQYEEGTEADHVRYYTYR